MGGGALDIAAKAAKTTSGSSVAAQEASPRSPLEERENVTSSSMRARNATRPSPHRRSSQQRYSPSSSPVAAAPPFSSPPEAYYSYATAQEYYQQPSYLQEQQQQHYRHQQMIMAPPPMSGAFGDDAASGYRNYGLAAYSSSQPAYTGSYDAGAIPGGVAQEAAAGERGRGDRRE